MGRWGLYRARSKGPDPESRTWIKKTWVISQCHAKRLCRVKTEMAGAMRAAPESLKESRGGALRMGASKVIEKKGPDLVRHGAELLLETLQRGNYCPLVDELRQRYGCGSTKQAGIEPASTDRQPCGVG